jgi:ADP-ribosylglycohydrolase
MGLVTAGLLCGQSREKVLASDWEPLQIIHRHKPLHPDILAIASGSYKNKSVSEISGSGYVVESLEAAMWSFHGAASFREAVLAAVNLGEDADTTGAVVGQLAGAYWGKAGIDPDLIAGLARRNILDLYLKPLMSVKQ